jgi:hypothetical protein
MNDEALRQFTHDRRHARECEAQRERLATHARRRRLHRVGVSAPTPGLALLLAARRHAIQ